jgi:hypothetical protein
MKSNDASNPLVPLVRYDGADVRTRLRDLLVDWSDDLAAVGRGLPQELALRGTARSVRETVEERLARPIHVVVVGEFKRGKSTLVNALLGEEVVTMDVTPETVAVTELHYGDAHKGRLHLKDGGLVDLTPEDLPSDRLRPLLDNLPAPVDHIVVTAPAKMLEDVVFVDTPGLADALWRFDRQVQEWLPRADVVLSVVSAISPLSATERAFLTSALRPQEFSKVNFVVNMVDRLPSTRDTERIMKRVRDILATDFPGAEVLGVSALDELARATGDPAPCPARSSELAARFSQLRSVVDRQVLVDQDVIRTERALTLGRQGLERIAERLRASLEALGSDRAELGERMRRLRQAEDQAQAQEERRAADIDEQLGKMAKSSTRWMQGFVDRFETEVVPTLGQRDHDALQKHLPFFLSSVLRDAFTACMDSHLGAISEMVAGVVPTGTSRTDSEPGGALQQSVDVTTAPPLVWTSIDNLNVINLILPGLAGLVGRVVAGILDRSKAQGERNTAFVQQVIEQLPHLRKAVTAAVAETYDALATEISQRVADAHKQDRETRRAIVDQALAAQAGGAEAVERSRRGATAALQRTDSVLDELEELQRALGGSV